MLPDSNNVKVAVRVRPTTGEENVAGYRPVFYASQEKGTIRLLGGEKQWSFDHVFGPNAK